jgi:PemK-like, MazF-like toxin of type II toxin-antitoxin system
LKLSQRDIILIPFPFSDLAGTKVRSALVISSNEYNKTSLDAVVVALTSNLSPSLFKVLCIQTVGFTKAIDVDYRKARNSAIVNPAS